MAPDENVAGEQSLEVNGNKINIFKLSQETFSVDSSFFVVHLSSQLK